MADSTESRQRFLEVVRTREIADKLRAQGELDDEQWQSAQNQLGAIDRGAFAEANVTEHPLKALTMLGFVPAEHLIRKSGHSLGRSEPSLESLAEGYRGIGRGLRNNWQQATAAMLRKPRQRTDSPYVGYDSGLVPMQMPPATPQAQQTPQTATDLVSLIRALRSP